MAENRDVLPLFLNGNLQYKVTRKLLVNANFFHRSLTITYMKTIQCFFVILLTTIGAYAQKEKSFFIGGGAGVNLASYFLTDDYANTWSTRKPVAGLTGGMTFGFQMGNTGIQSGIYYTQKGTRAETDNFRLNNGEMGYQTIKERTNFITIPLWFRYQFTGGKIGFSAAAGPSVNIALSGNYRSGVHSTGGASAYSSGSLSFGNGVRETYKGIQAAFCISPGVTFNAGNSGKFGVNLVFDLGFNAVNQRSSEANNRNGIISNMGTGLTFSYLHQIPFGKK